MRPQPLYVAARENLAIIRPPTTAFLEHAAPYSPACLQGSPPVNPIHKQRAHHAGTDHPNRSIFPLLLSCKSGQKGYGTDAGRAKLDTNNVRTPDNKRCDKSLTMHVIWMHVYNNNREEEILVQSFLFLRKFAKTDENVERERSNGAILTGR